MSQLIILVKLEKDSEFSISFTNSAYVSQGRCHTHHDESNQEQAIEMVATLANNRGKPNQFLFLDEQGYRDMLFQQYDMTKRLHKSLEAIRIALETAEGDKKLLVARLAVSRKRVETLSNKVTNLQLATSPKVAWLIMQLAAELGGSDDKN